MNTKTRRSQLAKQHLIFHTFTWEFKSVSEASKTTTVAGNFPSVSI